MAERTAFDETRWYRLRGDAAASRVVAICRGLQTDTGSANRARWFTARSKYEGRPVTDTGADSVVWTDDMYNLSRSAADTAQAEIASRQRPKPMFLTTGGDWRTQRKAKKLDKFVEAQMHQRQGARYSDAWEVGEDVFLDAEIAVGGVLKVSVDKGRGRVCYERVPAYEILVDINEARDGSPRNYFHVYPMDLDVAESTFADSLEEVTDDEGNERNATDDDKQKVRDRLQASAGFDKFSHSLPGGSMWRTTQSLFIYEAWWVSPDSKKPGRHVFACNDGILYEEEWNWPRPPLAIVVWSKEPFGVWGTGFVESSMQQHDHVNHLQRKVAERMNLLASRRTYYQAGTVNLEAMKRNEAEVFVECKDLSNQPRSEDTPPVQPAETMMVESEISRYFEMNGISQASAEQRKEPGVDAAVAMQTLNDIKGVRFMPKARSYELLFVEIGEMTVHAARDLAAANGGKLSAKWAGKKFLSTIDWNEADVDSDLYQVRVTPVSSMSRDPAQRLQIVEQLTNMGFLTRDKYLQLLQMPDLDATLELEGAEGQWIDKLVDRYLDAEDDDDLDKRGGFVEPDGYLLNPMAALIATAQHYFDALVNDAPEFNADLMRRFMTSLKNMIKKTQAPPPQAQPVGAAPMVQQAA